MGRGSLLILVFVLLWFVLTRFLLPKMGVST
jgi:hypothetical protein